MQFVVIKAT